MTNQEAALITWEAIAKYLGWSLSKVKKRGPELKAAGVVWVTWRGRPPHRSRVAFTFPSLLQRWLIIKSSRDGVI